MGRISIASSSGLALVDERYFRATGHVFWALVQFDKRLTLHKRDNKQSDTPWYKTDVISENVSGPAPLINITNRGTYNPVGNPSEGEATTTALVLEGTTLTEFPNMIRGQVITNRATGQASLIQSNFARDLGIGNFEALVLEGQNIVHYWRNNSLGFNSWAAGAIVSSTASGSACLIQGDFDGSNLEALIPEGNQLVHYWRTSKPSFQWHRGVVVCEGISGPATMIQSGFRANKKKHGNFEILVWQGRDIVHYWRDHSDPHMPWKRGVVVSRNATGPASMME